MASSYEGQREKWNLLARETSDLIAEAEAILVSPNATANTNEIISKLEGNLKASDDLEDSIFALLDDDEEEEDRFVAKSFPFAQMVRETLRKLMQQKQRLDIRMISFIYRNAVTITPATTIQTDDADARNATLTTHNAATTMTAACFDVSVDESTQINEVDTVVGDLQSTGCREELQNTESTAQNESPNDEELPKITLLPSLSQASEFTDCTPSSQPVPAISSPQQRDIFTKSSKSLQSVYTISSLQQQQICPVMRAVSGTGPPTGTIETKDNIIEANRLLYVDSFYTAKCKRLLVRFCIHQPQAAVAEGIVDEKQWMRDIQRRYYYKETQVQRFAQLPCRPPPDLRSRKPLRITAP